jgi:hypothetical protein
MASLTGTERMVAKAIWPASSVTASETKAAANAASRPASLS